MKKLFLPIIAVVLIQACDESDVIPTLKDEHAVIVEVLDDQNQKSDDVFMIVEEQPSYPGGQEAWNKHLLTNLKYPEEAKIKGIEGAVFISFVVNKDGSLEDYQVIRGIGAGCDAEALRVLMESENWNPGKQRGKIVKTKMQIRIVFKLDESADFSSPSMIEVKETVNRSLKEIDEENEVFHIVEIQPELEGKENWSQFASQNMDYPTKAKTKGIEGEVFATFVVDKDGSPIDIQLLRGIGYGCDEEVVRLIKASHWSPGEQRGQVVKTRMQVKVPFKLN